MVQRRRPRRNRRRNPRLRSEIARVASGLAYRPRRVRTDPVPMPVSLTHSTRVRFNVVHQYSKSSGGKFAIELANTPYASNNIYLYYQFSNGKIARTFDVKYSDIALAACMSLYGVDVSKSADGVNYLSTEMCINKVVLFGANDRTNSSEISLQVDFGGSAPGFTGRDTGDLNRRAVVAAASPRAMWVFVSKTAGVFCRCDVGLQRNPLFEKDIPQDWQASPNMTNFESGVLDVSVVLRRSWVNSLNTAPKAAAETKFVS